MTRPVLGVEIDEENEVVALLARVLYVHFQEHRNKQPSSAPFAPEWAYDYARLSVRYCGYDDDAVDRLRTDYK